MIFIFSTTDGIVEKQHNSYIINHQNYSRLTACYCSANANISNFESIENKNTNLKLNIISLPIHLGWNNSECIRLMQKVD